MFFLYSFSIEKSSVLYRERFVFLGMAYRALSDPCSGGFSDGLMQEGIPYQMALFFKGEM